MMNRLRSAVAIVGLAMTAALAGCGSTAGGATSPQPSIASASPIAMGDATLITPGTLTIGSDIPYAPQEFYDGSNNPAGFDVEIGRALAAHLGLKAAFVNQAFDQIIPQLDNRKFDVILSAMTITPERSPQVSFVPYFNAGSSLLVQASSTFRPRTVQDLCGHHVGVETATVEAAALKALSCGSHPATVSEYTDDPEGVQQLRLGKVEAHYTDSPPAAYAASQSGGKLLVSSGIIAPAPEGIAIDKTNMGLSTAIAKAFAALRTDGTYAKLLAKWGLKDGAIA